MLFRMRVRMLKPTAGIMRRVSLSHLAPGQVYDLEFGLAHYLISNGAAEEIPFTTSALPVSNEDKYIEHLTGGITVNQVNTTGKTAKQQAPLKRTYRARTPPAARPQRKN
jgi:hypothetical protein